MTIKLERAPLMDPGEIVVLRDLLVKYHPQRVLEWGSGGSTLTWPVMFPEMEWWTVEHNPAYYEALRSQVGSNVHLVHLPFPDYYNLRPASVGQFDFIIVDGRKRVECLSAARALLRPGAVAVLHDSSRERYRPAWAYYHEVQELVPPNLARGKDQRGLTLFARPRLASADSNQGG